MQIHEFYELVNEQHYHCCHGNSWLSYCKMFVFVLFMQKRIVSSVTCDILGDIPDVTGRFWEDLCVDGSLHQPLNTRQMFLMGKLTKGLDSQTWKAPNLVFIQLRWINHPATAKLRRFLFTLHSTCCDFNVNRHLVTSSVIQIQHQTDLEIILKFYECSPPRYMQTSPTWHCLRWWHPCTQGRGHIWLCLDLIWAIRWSWRSIT